ncbi:Long-chain-fatty-acid--CoA ligase 2 (Long-chain acyl-CoA synthetase 2) (Fatty acid activator 2) [Scheffersomyces stipitis CBS 6054]|uniref:Long-chain-fatty-acid--CoA ligase 2 (Long-chain acyl-CoA synthetase 2) (Fatty acid activator 2) n=1 Tax=Scheffersomyces stipitis (strain ATCC 58785 / CBS 6054 / NBRC 10063 / NRRL Y-11545) TaxID=322104 RepID=A3LZE8_PICST|nr:Long-chain-fatty-acid--CoA ligase 2 (Long-chain acyl-CoA synthetase 2) (Fatty acid activator 2) [Scheffersomyces stipitis CBS 6054]ABN68147.2 Long-chain-fatty-acid--CoA ligase 2 (Long-chain acyl-CoA synthetase 2) (Fatty acid activator 2) [Scheffersomyces stipitis CBS 6054]
MSLYPANNRSKEEALASLPISSISITNSVVVSGASADGNYSAVYRNSASPDKLISSIHPDLDTYHKLFNNAVARYGNRPCLGQRPFNYQTKQSASYYKNYTYNQVNQRKKNLGAGIIYSLQNNAFTNYNLESHRKIRDHLKNWLSYGVTTNATENTNEQIEKSASFIVSIFSANRYEWILTDLACTAFSITNTALYDTLGPDVTKYILELTSSPIVVCSYDKISTILDLKEKYPIELESIISIVSMDPFSTINNSLLAKASRLKVEISDLGQIEDVGASHPLDELPPSPDTLYTISFTSGTTGAKPKGAMLTQRNATCGMSFLSCAETHSRGRDRAFIFLPLTHIYERETSGFALVTGYYLGFPQLTIGHDKVDPFTNLIQDLRIFKPTYFSNVPRILTKMEALVKNLINEMSAEDAAEVKKIIEFKQLEHKRYDGSEAKNALYDNFPAYKSLQEAMGMTKLKWMQTGSAPVSPTTITFLKAALNIGIRQLYGLTESFGGITSTPEYEAEPGSCGSISPTIEARLRNVSEMGYKINDNKGEFVIRGHQIFKGYYYNKEETDKVFNSEGWFHTGDIARVDKNGRFFIIDRVKNFFKLAQGEYISPEKIENRYLSSNPIISQLYVHGDSLQSFLVGVVGVDFEKGLKFLNDVCGYNRIDMSSEEMIETINRVDIKKKFLDIINENVKDKLSGYEKLHNIHIEINPLTVERNVVTPTLKIKRGFASQFFSDVFHRLYNLEQSLLSEANYLKSKL